MKDARGGLALSLPAQARYVLRDARAPASLLEDTPAEPDAEGLCPVDLLVDGARIVAVSPARTAPEPGLAAVDLDGALVLPCFVDLHTHLDKGHIWPRTPNRDGSFLGALDAVESDRLASWSAADVRARMEFGLRAAYAHGTRALRTHLDSIAPQDAVTWPVFA